MRPFLVVAAVLAAAGLSGLGPRAVPAEPKAPDPSAILPGPVTVPAVPEPKPAQGAPVPTARPVVPATPAPVRTAAVDRSVTGSMPARGAVLFEDVAIKACVGGTLCPRHCAAAKDCEATPVYTIRLAEPRRITGLQVYAHDQVGAVRRADLVVKINGVPVGRSHVYRNGSVIGFRTDRVGQIVTIEAVHMENGHLLGGDEAVISQIYLFGDGN